MTATWCYSQNLQNNILRTQQIDSVKIPFIFIKKANKAFIEVKSLRVLVKLYQDQSGEKDLEIINLTSANNKCNQAYDTILTRTIPSLKKESDDNAKLYANFKTAYKAEKIKTLGLSVGVPVATVIGLLAGFLLFHK
jgi:hypothetical protein